MNNFNHKLVESLDVLNKVLAGIFSVMAVLKFFSTVDDSFVGAVFETLTIIGAGILTCGYIALMLNINLMLERIGETLTNGKN